MSSLVWRILKICICGRLKLCTARFRFLMHYLKFESLIAKRKEFSHQLTQPTYLLKLGTDSGTIFNAPFNTCYIDRLNELRRLDYNMETLVV